MPLGFASQLASQFVSRFGSQRGDGANESDGHFFDRFVDNITNLDVADTAVEKTTVGIEYAAQIGLFVIPAVLIVYALYKRRIPMLIASSGFLVFVAWYRFVTQDWEQRDNEFLSKWAIPVGDWTEQVTRWVDLNLTATLGVIEWPFRALLSVIVTNWLLNLSWLTVCFAVFLIGWAIRNFRIGALSFLGLAICGLLGDAYWLETSRTIGLIGVAVLLCVIIGVPIGVLCGRVDAVWRIVQPILDAMQVVHTFVYMLPFIFFFGIGPVSATMVTMVFALPPLIRLTNLGIRQVPEDVIEAARAYGAPEWRVLTDVQLPLARPALLAGLNQTMLLSISMLGIAAIMGAGGLGRLLFQAISNLDIALAGSGGLAFFLVAVVLDRLTQPVSGDNMNLLTRITNAWQNRRTPELFLEQRLASSAAAADATADATADAAAADDAEAQAQAEADEAGAVNERVDARRQLSLNGFTQTARYTSVKATELIYMSIGALAALIALLALLVLPWAHNAGPVSGYGRSSDLDLPGQSFNGIAAAGGSWFGIVILLSTVMVIVGALNTFIQPGKSSRWFAPGGATAFSTAAFFIALAYLLMSPPDDAINYRVGVGVYVALIALAVAVAACIAWTSHAPLTEKIQPKLGVSYSKLLTAGLVVALLVAAGYSGWSYDTRAEAVITPEVQAEIDRIDAEAQEAEEAGDLDRAGVLATELISKIAQARRTGDTVLDGFSGTGTGLGIWALLIGIVGAGLVPAFAGVFATDRKQIYLWSVLTTGIGVGLAGISLAWIFSQVRSADTNFVSGVGAVFLLAAGAALFAASASTWDSFERQRQYAKMRDNGEKALST